jgi:hypothetical protein
VREKQGLFSAGGVTLTISFICALMLHVTYAVTMGYFTIYATPIPFLFPVITILVTKWCTDEHFSNWTFPEKIVFCLIASIFPITTPRPRQDEEEVESETTYVMKKKKSSQEITFLYMVQAINFVLGLLVFGVLLNFAPGYEASIDSVKRASSVDLTLAMFVGGPIALMASVAFRIIYIYCEAWKEINGPRKCKTDCSCCRLPMARSIISTSTPEVPAINLPSETPAAELNDMLDYLANQPKSIVTSPALNPTAAQVGMELKTLG